MEAAAYWAHDIFALAQSARRWERLHRVGSGPLTPLNDSPRLIEPVKPALCSRHTSREGLPMIRRVYRLVALLLLICGGGVAWGQAAPAASLTATCTAPCNAPATITLSATTTVASGRSVSKVEFYDGATLLATDTTSPYSSTRTAVIGGSHSFTAKVYDNAATPLTGVSAAKVIAVNTAPTVTLVAACGANPCVSPATVTLTATPADVDGSITKVEFYRGATLISTKTAAPWTFTDAALAAATYSYTAKAFDNAATPLSTTSTAQAITVATAPTVTLTATCTAPCNAPAAITLTATTTVGAGLAVSKVEFYEGTTLLATDTKSPYSSAHTAVTGGSHTYTAKVYDNATTPLTATSTAIAIAVNTAPTVSLVAACNANPCNAPAAVTLTATPADAGGTISKVEFYRGATLLTTKTAAPWTYSDAALAAGSYSYTAKAFDNATTALATTSTAQAITVVVPVTPPTVTLTAACTAPCNAPATVTLSASTTVASGRTVSKVEFYEGATLLATDTTSSYSSTRTSVAGGTHTYSAKVYDSGTTPLTATSTAIVVAVNTAPTVSLTATCNASPCSAPATVTLTATPADADGLITKVEFYRGATLLATKTAAPWTWADNARPVGTFSYTAKAFDNGTTSLATTSAAQSVAVTAATGTNVPITIDGSPVTVVLPAALPPKLTFSAKAGDVLTLRVLEDVPYSNLRGALVPQINGSAISCGRDGAETAMFWGTSAYADHYEGAVWQCAAALRSGSMFMMIRQDGDFSVRLTDYGIAAQTVRFVLMRAAAPATVTLDAPGQTATTNLAGQTLLFHIPSGPVGGQTALSIDPVPGWSVPANNTHQYYSYMLISPSFNIIKDEYGTNINFIADAIAALDRIFIAAEVGVYTLLLTPHSMSSGGVTVSLTSARDAGTLIVDGAPVTWMPTRTPVDGPTYQFSAIAGHEYTLFLSQLDVNGPTRSFSFNVKGSLPNPSPYPQIQFGSVGGARFTPSESGTYAISLLESERPALNGPVTVSLVDAFSPVVSFVYPAHNLFYFNGPYYNVVQVQGAGAMAPTRVDIYGYYTGYSRGDTFTVATCVGSNVLTCNFKWTGSTLGSLPQSIYAVATFTNGVRVTSDDLRIVRVQVSGVAINPVMLNDGATVIDDQISFMGDAFGSKFDVKNISVFLNGAPIPTASGGAFVANNVALQMGSNTIALVAHTIDESSAPVVQYTVTRTGTPDFSVQVDRDFGRTPHTTNVRITNRANVPWGRISIDADDDGVEDRSIVPGVDPVVTTGFTYTTPGRATIRITIYRPDGSLLFETRRYVLVVSPTDVVPIVAEAYAGVQDKLRIGNITAAANYISDGALDRFRSVFQAIGSANLSQYFGTLDSQGLGQIQVVRVTDQTAELVVSRGDGLNRRVFRLYFMKDIDGLWRIIEM